MILSEYHAALMKRIEDLTPQTTPQQSEEGFNTDEPAAKRRKGTPYINPHPYSGLLSGSAVYPRGSPEHH